MHALVISPIPTNPANQGNAVRIARFCEILQYCGYQVHFLYYGMEGATADTMAEMIARWDFVHFVPVELQKVQSVPQGFLIDDYYGSEVTRMIFELRRQWHFSLAIINYVWMSAACEALDDDTFKVIDTHDIFGERQYLLQQQQVAPAWFFTSAFEESKGLDRADLVIAIQSNEAAILRERTLRPVATVGHILPANFCTVEHTQRTNRLRVGYLASGNPSNRKSLLELVQAISQRPEILDHCQFEIGGEIGRYVPPGMRGVNATGYVEDPLKFYRSVDIVVNPNVSGSGLKIKNVEALSFGLPLVSTISGMAGIQTDEAAHLCMTLSDVLDHLRALLAPARRRELAEATRRIFLEYTNTQLASFIEILTLEGNRGAIHGHRRNAQA